MGLRHFSAVYPLKPRRILPSLGVDWDLRASPMSIARGTFEGLLAVNAYGQEPVGRETVVDDSVPFRFDEGGGMLPRGIVFVVHDAFAA